MVHYRPEILFLHIDNDWVHRGQDIFLHVVGIRNGFQQLLLGLDCRLARFLVLSVHLGYDPLLVLVDDLIELGIELLDFLQFAIQLSLAVLQHLSHPLLFVVHVHVKGLQLFEEVIDLLQSHTILIGLRIFVLYLCQFEPIADQLDGTTITEVEILAILLDVELGSFRIVVFTHILHTLSPWNCSGSNASSGGVTSPGPDWR